MSKFMSPSFIIAALSLLLLLMPLTLFLNAPSYASSSASTFTSKLDWSTTTAGTGDQDSNGNSNSNSNSNSNTKSPPNSRVEQAKRYNSDSNALRRYTNSAFNLTVQYPSTWGAMELKANPYPYTKEDTRSSPVVVILSPLENESDNFQEKVLISTQNLPPSMMTLEDYTNSSLRSYHNQSDIFKILESAPTTLAGQPAHKIVFTDESVKGIKSKKIQVWTVLNNSRAYLVTFASEESKYADYLPQIQKILSSFRINTDIDNNTREQGNLTFNDPMFGIKVRYPSSWTKIQPGLPIDNNRTFVFISSFNSPTPTPSVSTSDDNNTNNGSSNSNSNSNSSSPATISIGINDVSRFISGMTNDSASSNKTSTATNVVGNRNVSLAEYSSKQIEHIRQIGAQLRSTSPTTIADLPAHKIYYLVDERLLIMQAWTLNEGKAYHIALSANDPDTFAANLPVFYEMLQSMQFNFDSTKRDTRSSD